MFLSDVLTVKFHENNRKRHILQPVFNRRKDKAAFINR